MLKSLGIGLAFGCLWALPCFAQGTACAAPAAPAVNVDPVHATKDQMVAAVNEVKAFIAASDQYQDCLDKNMTAQKAAATPDKPFDPAIERELVARAAANQSLKQRAGDQINQAVTAWRSTHPGG
jgi:hypothetical protein